MGKNLSELVGKDIDLNIDNWISKETDNFIFHFQRNTNVPNIDKFINDKEQTFNKINSIFKAKLPKKIDYFVWNSNEDALKEIGRTLGFAIPTTCVVHTLKDQTLGHEMTHVIVGNIDGADIQIGLINEGLATYFDQTIENKLAKAKDKLYKLKEKE